MRKVKADYQVPISITLAQSALESGWGLQKKGNAYFGIKGKAPDGSSVMARTSEYEAGEKIHNTQSFRAYESYEEAADDYGKFLRSSPQFESCFAVTDNPLAFADRLQRGTYGTGPEYAATLKKIITGFGLLMYDK